MSRQSGLRASDADREHIAERLRQATTEGRLSPEELDERLGVAFSARTYGELHPLVADLPNGVVTRRRRSPLATSVRLLVAVAILVPLIALVVATAVLVLTGLAAGWVVWMLIAWWFLGMRGRRRYGPGRPGHRGHRRDPRRFQQTAGRSSQVRSGFWL
jgi:Domain of unknown function (DUF1707)